jgi:hypothetical protein
MQWGKQSSAKVDYCMCMTFRIRTRSVHKFFTRIIHTLTLISPQIVRRRVVNKNCEKKQKTKFPKIESGGVSRLGTSL